MSFTERISLSGEFNDLIARNENQREFRDANVINTDNQDNSINQITPTSVEVEDRLAVDNTINPTARNEDGDAAMLSEDGMQLAQNLDVNSPLSLD